MQPSGAVTLRCAVLGLLGWAGLSAALYCATLYVELSWARLRCGGQVVMGGEGCGGAPGLQPWPWPRCLGGMQLLKSAAVAAPAACTAQAQAAPAAAPARCQHPARSRQRGRVGGWAGALPGAPVGGRRLGRCLVDAPPQSGLGVGGVVPHNGILVDAPQESRQTPTAFLTKPLPAYVSFQ